MIKVLFLPNWEVYYLEKDDLSIPTPNKIVKGKDYWFFKYLPEWKVDIIDNTSLFPLNLIERNTKIQIFQQIRAILKENKYDLIISHSYLSGFIFSVIRSLVNIKFPPHFIIDIGCLNGGVENKLQINILKFAIKSVSGLIYHSKVNENFYSKYFYNIPRKYITFGVDPEFFRPLEYSPSQDYILSIGYAKRDYITLLKSWEKINYPLKIVGTTALDVQSLKNVKLIPKVPINVLKELIHNALFIVLPIVDVPYSVGQMTLLQCMAMEKTVIVTRVPGILDYVKDNVNGIFVKYRSYKDLIEKVEYLLSNPEEIRRIGINARYSILENYTEEKMAKDIYRFIKET